MNLLLTGATGMVGEGVLLTCLADPRVTGVTVVVRRPTGMRHAKLRELIAPDFRDLSGIDAQLAGFDGCLYCAGISSRGLSEAEYTQITFDTPLRFAEAVLRHNPGMTFVHVSGAHTDGTGQGRVMWARVKGRAENALSRLPFKAVYHVRPGLMKPLPGQQRVPGLYRAIQALYPLMALLFPGMTLGELGQVMLRCVEAGAPKPVLEVADMRALLGDTATTATSR